MMGDSLDDLVHLLSQEADEYGKLLALLSDEERALVQGRSADVAELTKQKERLALELKVLEEARQALIRRLAGPLGLPTGEVTLTRLIEAVPQNRAPALRDLRGRLTELMGRPR